MTQDNDGQQLSEDRRKEIFLALVDAQDHEMSVAQSRTLMAQQFGVSESQVRLIEREGIELEWPPLGECKPEMCPSQPRYKSRSGTMFWSDFGGRT